MGSVILGKIDYLIGIVKIYASFPKDAKVLFNFKFQHSSIILYIRMIRLSSVSLCY